GGRCARCRRARPAAGRRGERAGRHARVGRIPGNPTATARDEQSEPAQYQYTDLDLHDSSPPDPTFSWTPVLEGRSCGRGGCLSTSNARGPPTRNGGCEYL